jgi:GAF domain-containing protein
VNAITVPGTDVSVSGIYVPLIQGTELFGIIGLENSERENAFSESDLRLLTTLANSMSVALENARLFDETQRLFKAEQERAAELAIINRVQDALASKLDLQAIFEAVGEELVTLFGEHDVSLSTYDAATDRMHPHFAVERGQRHSVAEYRPGPIGRAITGSGTSYLFSTRAELLDFGAIDVPGSATTLSG